MKAINSYVFNKKIWYPHLQQWTILIIVVIVSLLKTIIFRIDMNACAYNVFQKTNVLIADCRLLIPSFILWTKMWRCRESQGHTDSDSRSRFEYQCHGYVERMEDQRTTCPRKFWSLKNIGAPTVGVIVGSSPDLMTEFYQHR